VNEILPNQYSGCLQQFIECCASHDNELSESHTLHMGVHDFLSMLSTSGRDGGTNFIFRIKEQETCLTLQEHDDDDDIPHLLFGSDEICT